MPFVALLAVSRLVPFADKAPADNDVKAGWVAFAVFVGLAAAVVFLGLSLNKQLRRARDAAEHGVYGEEDIPDRPAEPVEETTDGDDSDS